MGKEHKGPVNLDPLFNDMVPWSGNKVWVPWSDAITGIWYHGISAKEWCKRKYCGFDWWIIMIILSRAFILFYILQLHILRLFNKCYISGNLEVVVDAHTAPSDNFMSKRTK